MFFHCSFLEDNAGIYGKPTPGRKIVFLAINSETFCVCRADFPSVRRLQLAHCMGEDLISKQTQDLTKKKKELQLIFPAVKHLQRKLSHFPLSPATLCWLNSDKSSKCVHNVTH